MTSVPEVHRDSRLTMPAAGCVLAEISMAWAKCLQSVAISARTDPPSSTGGAVGFWSSPATSSSSTNVLRRRRRRPLFCLPLRCSSSLQRLDRLAWRPRTSACSFVASASRFASATPFDGRCLAKRLRRRDARRRVERVTGPLSEVGASTTGPSDCSAGLSIRPGCICGSDKKPKTISACHVIVYT